MMDDPSSSNNSNNPRRSSSNFRRLLLIFYTFLAIFTFTYWEEIQLWYRNNNSGASKKISKSTSGSFHSSNETATTATTNPNNLHHVDMNNTTTAGEGIKPSSTLSSSLVFCGTCIYLGDTSCNDRVDYLLHHLPESNPTEEMARQNLMRVGHCIESSGDLTKKEQEEEVLVDPTKKQQGEEEVTAADRCTFCEKGVTIPDFVIPHANGYTCEQIRAMVLSTENPIKNGTAVCETIQKEEENCCGAAAHEVTTADRCTFCEKGLAIPDFVIPHLGGRTCRKIQAIIVGNTIKNGTTLCETIQKEEENCCGANSYLGKEAAVTINFRKDLSVTIPTTRNMRHDNGTFIGASEWYRYWTMAKNVRRRNRNNSSKNNTDSFQSNIDHSHDEEVLSLVKADFNKAIEHTRKMKARYDEVNAIPDYRARGLGWIEQRLGMVLSVAVVGDNSAAAAATGEATVLPAGNISIFIVDTIGDIKCGGNDINSDELSDNWMEYHPPLTMWVRANGPEIFAGTALPHVFTSASSPDDRHRCAWRYDFEPQMAGEYSIYAKVLTFNGFADWDKNLCKTHKLKWESKNEEDSTPSPRMQAAIAKEFAKQGNFSHHRGLMAFKNYDKLNSCCEACTRTRGCQMWSVPGEIDECELYFDKIEDDIDFWDSDMGKHLGRDRDYSYVRQEVSEFPVYRRRLGQKNRRELAMNRGEIFLQKWPNLNVPDSYGYPRAEPTKDFIGCGWSNLKSFESPCHYPSDDLVFGSGKRIEIAVDSNEQIHNATIASKVEGKRACTLEDESFGNGRWVKYPFPDDSVCMPVEQDRENGGFQTYMPRYDGTSMPPYCWHRDNIDKCCNVCAEMGCKFIVNHRWVSDLRQTGKWFGRFENYDCRYDDMSSAEIQQCIDRKNISKIEVQGASVKNVLEAYIAQKLKGIQMVEQTETSRTIYLDTLKMPHVVWHQSMKEFGNNLDQYPEVDNETTEHYFVTGFYFSSEREPHVIADRSLQFSNLAWEKLTPKGYKMINAFDATAAFTYDSDGQNDGLHITGPPIRATLTKFFHHLCQE